MASRATDTTTSSTRCPARRCPGAWSRGLSRWCSSLAPPQTRPKPSAGSGCRRRSCRSRPRRAAPSAPPPLRATLPSAARQPRRQQQQMALQPSRARRLGTQPLRLRPALAMPRLLGVTALPWATRTSQTALGRPGPRLSARSWGTPPSRRRRTTGRSASAGCTSPERTWTRRPRTTRARCSPQTSPSPSSTKRGTLQTTRM
mmetsp:Transcript_10345/g.40232  ORF Transcript_10345/g.40232 Transcript_10345/m.40232 type:complete len:202 (+) Transcript_10345:83-688(+)